MTNNLELPIEKSIKILQENLKKIDRVYEWSVACGYTNPKKFSRMFRNYYGERPSKVLIRTKVELAIKMLSNGEGLNNYEIALEIGKSDEQALFHFIKQQTGNPPDFYKSQK